MVLMYAKRSMLGKRKRYRYTQTRANRDIPWKTLSRKTRAVALARTGGYIGGQKELKFHDETLSSHAVTNSLAAAAALAENATNNQLCGVVQGVSSNQRIGRCMYIKSVYLKGHITLPAASAIENNGYLSLWVVEDTQTNGAQMSVTDFLFNPAGTTCDADAMQHLQYSDRFKLIAHKVIRFPPRNTFGSTTDAVGAQDIPFKVYRKLNIKKEHSGTTAAVGDSTTSSLHVIAIRSDSAHASTTISYNARIRYTD
jgi:hypothetical protein